MDIYGFTAKGIDGKEIAFSKYKGKALIVVNTASKCGFTPQYEGLEKLYRKYRDHGLEILGFPSNEFAGQEPGSNGEVMEFCTRNYGVSFQMFEKTSVRGAESHPLFAYLTGKRPFAGFNPKHPIAAILEKTLRENFPAYLDGDSIKWNFTKFLIDKEGNVIARFEPTTDPSEMETFVRQALGL